MIHYGSKRIPGKADLQHSTSLQGHDWMILTSSLRLYPVMGSSRLARNSQAKKNINDVAICRTGE